jgi:integral membrane sensor domain MASE1
MGNLENPMADQLSTENPGYPGKYQIAVKLLFVALVYFVSGRMGLALPSVDSHITLIWLPTGIAVAALLRSWVRWQPTITLTLPRCSIFALHWAIHWPRCLPP